MSQRLAHTYRRPPLLRACDPQRMNWLWRLICEAGQWQPAQIMEALQAAQIPVDFGRVRSWTVPDTDEAFFPMNLAEVERNLRALITLRQARPAPLQPDDGIVSAPS